MTPVIVGWAKTNQTKQNGGQQKVEKRKKTEEEGYIRSNSVSERCTYALTERQRKSTQV